MMWKPLFVDADREAIWQKIHEIAQILLIHHTHDHSLMHGDLGSVFFLLHYCFETGNEECYQSAISQFSRCIESQNDLSVEGKQLTDNSSFENGFSGLGWMVNYLQTHDMVDGDIYRIMGTIDPWLFRDMIYKTQRNANDFMQGSSGIALYCLNRQERFAQEFLNRFVLELYKQVYQEKFAPVHDYSIPTGISGLFLLLRKIRSQYLKMNFLHETIELCQSAIERQNVAIKDSTTLIPGWNQNEIGILWSQMQFKETPDHVYEQWDNYANIYLGANDEAIEAGLYGGNFSLGHLYNRIYQLSGKEKFKEYAIAFLQKGLSHANHTEKRTGYKVWLTDINGRYSLHPGILGGLAGIGLVLLASVSEESPDWDELLLLS